MLVSVLILLAGALAIIDLFRTRAANLSAWGLLALAVALAIERGIDLTL